MDGLHLILVDLEISSRFGGVLMRRGAAKRLNPVFCDPKVQSRSHISRYNAIFSKVHPGGDVNDRSF